MSQLQSIEIPEECPYCGTPLVLETTASQQQSDDMPNIHSYCCSDGDRTYCPGCGLEGIMMVDANEPATAYFHYDPDTDNNSAAYDRASNMDGLSN